LQSWVFSFIRAIPPQVKIELTPKQVAEIKTAFDLFDADGSESIDASVRLLSLFIVCSRRRR
jgi:hypothetical protein